MMASHHRLTPAAHKPRFDQYHEDDSLDRPRAQTLGSSRVNYDDRACRSYVERRPYASRRWSSRVFQRLKGFAGGWNRRRKDHAGERPCTSFNDLNREEETCSEGSSRSNSSRSNSSRRESGRAIRTVSFNSVVKALLIETREQRYGNLAAKHAAFYSQADVQGFKRDWSFHVLAHRADDGTTIQSQCAEDGYVMCECAWCSTDDQHNLFNIRDLRRDSTITDPYATWTWEG